MRRLLCDSIYDDGKNFKDFYFSKMGSCSVLGEKLKITVGQLYYYANLTTYQPNQANFRPIHNLKILLRHPTKDEMVTKISRVLSPFL